MPRALWGLAVAGCVLLVAGRASHASPPAGRGRGNVVGGCMLAIEPTCIECVETRGHICPFAGERCSGSRRWFADGCPDTYENPLYHQTTQRVAACVVAEGAEVVHNYAWTRDGAPWPPDATRVSDCERRTGRFVPAEPRARVTP